MSKLFASRAAVAAVALCSLAVPAVAQTDAPPAYVAILDGDVTLVREAQPVNAIVNMPIVAGDRLTTTAGRVEVLYPDGAALDLDEGTTADFGADGRIRLSSGRAILVVPASTSQLNTARYEIDTPSGVVVTRGPGQYRADANGATPWALNTRANGNDAFEGWSDALRAARTAPAASPSARYLPEELRSYDTTLDQGGTWQYAPTYGYVWYPRVEGDWRPYYEGSWTSVPSYGWTWVGVHRWEYPTHHYGRWGYANNRWFWIPGRAYSPAWVAWGYASDYVGWCPLGIDSRPVFAMTVGYGYPWTGWTVMSRSHFGGRGYVPRLAVPPHQLPAQTPFVVQRGAPTIAPRADVTTGLPAASGVAVPRSIGTPGNVAVPRGSAPAAAQPAPAPAAPSVQRPATADPGAIPRNPSAAASPATPRAPGAQRRPAADPYAPNYSPPQPNYAVPRATTPSAPAQTPASTPAQPSAPSAATPATPPPAGTPPAAAPRNNAAGSGGASGAAPRSAPPSTTPPATAVPRSAPPPKSGAAPTKPSEGAKPRGRGL